MSGSRRNDAIFTEYMSKATSHAKTRTAFTSPEKESSKSSLFSIQRNDSNRMTPLPREVNNIV